MKKIEIIHQHDTMQCGIACLQMISWNWETKMLLIWKI